MTSSKYFWPVVAGLVGAGLLSVWVELNGLSHGWLAFLAVILLAVKEARWPW